MALYSILHALVHSRKMIKWSKSTTRRDTTQTQQLQDDGEKIPTRHFKLNNLMIKPKTSISRKAMISGELFLVDVIAHGYCGVHKCHITHNLQLGPEQ